MKRWSEGDIAVFRVEKCTSKPGPRAKHVQPFPRGEGYVYEVDKFWIVARELEEDQLLLRTARGKEHVLRADHPRLRRPNLWERLRFRARFATLRQRVQDGELPEPDRA